MTIYLEEEVKPKFDFDYQKVAEEVINAALDYVDFPYESELSITLTDLDGIHGINKEFRGIDAPTDVLSFPLIEYTKAGDFSELESIDIFNPETGEAMLGDIVLCIPRIESQALEFGHSVKREYAFLIAHSMLHLFGYDHMTEDDAKVMEEKQKAILEILKISRE